MGVHELGEGQWDERFPERSVVVSCRKTDRLSSRGGDTVPDASKTGACIALIMESSPSDPTGEEVCW